MPTPALSRRADHTACPSLRPPTQRSCQTATLFEIQLRRFRQVGVSGARLPASLHLPIALPALPGAWVSTSGLANGLERRRSVRKAKLCRCAYGGSRKSGETPFPWGRSLFACLGNSWLAGSVPAHGKGGAWAEPSTAKPTVHCLRQRLKVWRPGAAPPVLAVRLQTVPSESVTCKVVLDECSPECLHGASGVCSLARHVDRVAFLKRSRFYTGHAVCTTFSTALKHGRRRVLPYSPSRLRESFSCRGRTPVNRGGCALPFGEVETLLPKPQSQVAKLWEAESTSCWWIPNEAIPPHISSLPVTVAGVRNPGFL